MDIIRTTKVKGLLTRLTRTFIGAVDDEESEVSLIECAPGEYNVAIRHPTVQFGNPGAIYLYAEPVDEEKAMDKYNKLIKLILTGKEDGRTETSDTI